MTPVARTPVKLLDSLILLWIMPPLGFLLTLLQSAELRYLISNHALIALLAGAIAIRWLAGVTRAVGLRLLLAGLLALAFLCIEWVHFLAGRPTIDGLQDVRMIVYSSFYGSIIVFVLYAIYLATLDGAQQQRHLGFFVRLMSWFHLVFLIYWLLLYGGWVPPVPKADLLRSNSTAYGALFVLCLMALYRERIRMGAGWLAAFAGVNVAVILVNRTRGAIVALIVVALYLVFVRMGHRQRAVLAKAMAAALVGIAVAAMLMEGTAVTKLLGQDAHALGSVLAQIERAYDSGEHIVQVGPELVRDESTLSAFSRIGSNYYSLLSLIDHVLLGIGQADAYAIDVIGSGVHSLHFLLANATGLLGLALFTAALVALAVARPVRMTSRWLVMLVLCFGYILVFVNAVPVYFALVLVALGDRKSNDPWQAARAPGWRSPGGFTGA